MLILITPVVEQGLYDRYVFSVETREWGALRGPHSHGKICHMAEEVLGGPVGKYLSFGMVYFDLGDGGGVLD